MKTSHTLVSVSIVLFLVAMAGSVAYAWPGLSHILITEEADYPELKFYANLPDTYPSRQEGWELFMPSNYFSWTHIRLTVRDWGAPIEGVEDPAYDMWILATKKLEGLSGQELDVARKTALGWRAHMAADRIVHWDYFNAPEWWQNPLIWVTQHLLKEEEVDILVYVDKVCGGDLEEAFNVEFDEVGNWVGGNGRVKRGYAVQWPGHWGLVSLAQRVYLKNQRKSDETEDETIWPETAGTIGGRAATRESELQDAINGWGFGDWDPYVWNEYEEACQDFAQLLTRDALAETSLLYVRHMYWWQSGMFVRVYSVADGSFDLRQIDYVNRAQGSVSLVEALSKDYHGDGTVGSDYVVYMPGDRWDPYEWYWVPAVEAVKQQVPLLEQE